MEFLLSILCNDFGSKMVRYKMLEIIFICINKNMGLTCQGSDEKCKSYGLLECVLVYVQ